MTLEMICCRHPFHFESHMKLNINILKQFIHFLLNVLEFLNCSMRQ